MEKKVFVTKTIRSMGKTYRSVEEMPPEVRQAYDQAMASLNGIGEFHSEKIVINDKEYTSADEMPPEVRQIYEEMLKSLGNSTENLSETTSTRIFFEGQEYSSVEEMPPHVRSSYEQMQGLIQESLENQEEAKVTEIIVNEKKSSNAIPGNTLQRFFSRLPTRQRTITIIEDHSEKPEDAEEESEKPGLDSFLAILAGITVFYLMYLLIPGKHEPWAKFIARQPTWGSFFRGWIFIVLPISSFLWLGIYLLRGRFFTVLSLAMKILMVGLILLIIAMILSALFGW